MTSIFIISAPSGSGKSRLALSLVQASETGALRFSRLVADDRARLQACNGRLLVRPAEALAGLIEVRGLGIRRLPYEPLAVVGCVVDLGTPEGSRLPEPAERKVVIAGIELPRLAVAPGEQALSVTLAWFRTGTA